MTHIPGLVLGIYEKALPWCDGWPQRLATAAELGFDYVEMSIDPSEEYLSRLTWSQAKRAEMRHQMEDTNLAMRSICLSAHRYYPLGSSSLARRERGLEIMQAAIALASDLGVRIIQVAGYDTYEEPSDERSYQRYIEGLEQAVVWASERMILLGLENQEKGYVRSPSVAVDVIRRVGSPYLNLYMDLGNLVVNDCDVLAEIEAARGYLIGIHVKDACSNEPRRVPLGEGQVPFDAAFRKLADMRFHGPVTIEMWNEDRPDAALICAQAREYVMRHLAKAWGNENFHA
jgi:L-ribulose-5-phosphate 3-epimerase